MMPDGLSESHPGSAPSVQNRPVALSLACEDVHFTLAERMAQLWVPGLSIAVFDQYEWVWAK